MIDETVHIRKKDIIPANSILFDAFSDDPVWGAIFEGIKTIQILGPLCFKMPLKHCMKYGEIIASSEAIVGVACMTLRKYAEMSFLRILLCGRLMTGLRLGGNLGGRIGNAFTPIVKIQKKHMGNRDYLYLLALGVGKEYQGKGFGGRLLKSAIKRSEIKKVPLYLETFTEKNVSMYEHFGFKVLNKFKLPLVEKDTWDMVRELEM